MTTAVHKTQEDAVESDTKNVTSRPQKRAPHRHDLDGLRAFAIVLVVVYHVWVGRVSGGVDVFLLLSAFFMTASLVRKAEGGSLGLGTYWVNRFWRLVPVAALTIGGVLVMTYYLLPQGMWETVWSQSWASLFYWQNWELAATSVDYYARDSGEVSPLLHFWSLSVQGQVFILWPLLIALCWGIARATKLPVRAVALGAFSGVFVFSLAYSIITTATNQMVAYYDTGARLWEFALGSLVALVPLPKSLPRWVAEVIGWGAIVALLLCGMVLDVSGGFPGYLALWPTLAAVAIIAVGGNKTSFSAALGSAPLRWLGKIAYPLYLVHWPILVGVMIVAEVDRPSIALGAGIVMASFALAIIIRYLYEKPLQKIRFTRKSFAAGVVSLAVVVSAVAVPLASWRQVEEDRAANLAASTEHPGAEVLDLPLGYTDPNASLVPLGSQLAAEWATLDRACTPAEAPRGVEALLDCSRTVVSPDAPTLLVVGDSHAKQWLGSLAPIAIGHGYNVTAVLRGGCAFALDEYLGGAPGCDVWRDEVVNYINETKPDIVATVGTRVLAAEDADEREMEGMQRTLDLIRDSVGQVILMRDNPRFDQDMFACVELNRGDPTACAVPIRRIYAEENPAQDLSGPQTHVVDMSDYFCPEDMCWSVIGNVIVYIDDNHVGKTFMQTLVNPLTRRLDEAGVQW